MLSLVDGVSTLLRELECKELKQADIALTYALLIQGKNDREVDWGTVNRAIMKRWPKGLKRVKTLAWAIVEKARAEASAS